jgi:hypothetical protein
MRFSWGKKTAVFLAIALALGAYAPASWARSQKNLDKQARKMQGKLAKYQPGSLLHFSFRDGTESTGKLSTLSDNSFNFTNSESNANETHPYGDVKKVEKGKEYIGKGSTEKHRHIHIF